MSEGTTFKINYDEYVAYQQAPKVLQDYIFRLSEEIETKDAVFKAIAQTPEGRVAMAKVILLELDNVNTIIDDVIGKLEAKGQV